MKKLILSLFIILAFIRVNAIQQIRWGSTGDPLNGLTITWRNPGLNDSIRWGYTASMANGRYAGVRRNGYSDYFFNYTFPSLSANSIIYYELYDSQSSSWGSQMTYKTSPPVNTTNYSFIGIGDTRTNVSIWNQASLLAKTKNTNFTIYCGDIVNDGSVNSDWDGWFNNGTQFLENNLVYHCIGNHDATDTAKYRNNFTLPSYSNTTLHYYFIYSNAIFICMDSEDTTVAEFTWMANVLQANQSKTWKIVYFHRPFFTIGPHAGEMNGLLNTWWAAFDQYGVDLILNGHDHMYERSKPINYSVSTTSPVSNYGSGPGEGRCQVVCGSAGAPLYTGTPSWFTKTYNSVYHFCKFNVINGNTIKDSTFSYTGTLIDTFTLSKTSLNIESGKIDIKPLSISPNPSDGIFTLKYNSASTGEITISIFNVYGGKVKEEKILKTKNEIEYKINLSKYSKGVYNVEVKSGKSKDSSLIILK